MPRNYKSTYGLGTIVVLIQQLKICVGGMSDDDNLDESIIGVRKVW